MGCGIDTAGKTRGDDETFDSKVCGEAAGEFRLRLGLGAEANVVGSSSAP
jgi:hypothetical protein